MRLRIAAAAFAALWIAACSNGSDEPTAPPSTTNVDAIDLLPDYTVSAASDIDGSGIGASELPDSLKLTAEQKAAIQALHEAFRAAIKADVDALKAIEADAKAARQAGKSRAEIRAILARGIPNLLHIRTLFDKLQDDVWAVFTPAQKAWITLHRPRLCRLTEPPALTEAQVAEIRALREAFVTATQADVALVKQVAADARAARAAGKSSEEIKAILARATDALKRLREAELELHKAILGVLTPDQRNIRCLVRLGHQGR